MLLGVMSLALLVLAGCGAFGGGANNSAESGAPSESLDANKVIKISATGEGLPQDILNKIAQIENVNEVQGYLNVVSGESQVWGADVTKPLIFEEDGNFVIPEAIEGRLLEAGDAGQPVMIAGKIYAENNETAYGYPILGMAGMQAPFILDNNQITIMGVYQTGSAEADNRIVLPIEIVQQLYGKTGVNVVYVTLDNAENPSSVIDQVKQIVGEKAEVQ
jgi:ABC-type lipoprotein release transport system permease subunit